MPLNKKSFRRYKIINGLLSSYRKYTLREIADKVNEQLAADGFSTVTDRMIYNDIEDMGQIFGVSVRKYKGFVFYEDKNDSIEKLPLTEEDKSLLEMALQTFRLYQGSSFFKKFNDTINRLMTGAVLRKIQVEDPSNYIQVGEMYEDGGQKWIESLYQSIVKKEAVTWVYAPYGKKPLEMTISPYLLKEYRNNWYLVGYFHAANKKTSDTRVFKLNRITSIANSKASFYTDPQFDKANYFKYSLGVFQNQGTPPIKVVLQFPKDYIQLIMENPLHDSMTVLAETSNYLKISLEVYDSIELKNLILGFGEQVEVLEPSSLRQSIQQAILKMYQKYSPSGQSKA